MIVTYDANLFVYASGRTLDSRRERALDVIERGIRCGRVIITLQVLGEFCNVAVRKMRMSLEHVEGFVDSWRQVFPVEGAAEQDIPVALEAVRDHKLQFWDAMLWASAHRVGVRYLISEDLQDGRTLGGVTFVNPFNPDNDALIDRILPT